MFWPTRLYLLSNLQGNCRNKNENLLCTKSTVLQCIDLLRRATCMDFYAAASCTQSQSEFRDKKTTPIIGGVCFLVLCMWMWFLIALYNMQHFRFIASNGRSRIDSISQARKTPHATQRGDKLKYCLGWHEAAKKSGMAIWNQTWQSETS